VLVTSGTHRLQRLGYAAFLCPPLSFAHLARWNAAIFLRAAGDIVRVTGAVVFFLGKTNAGCDSFLALAHLALCARAIFRREAAEIIRVGADLVPVGADVIPVGWDAPVPFSDWISEIA
jgi:hypothetical protein